MFAGSSHESFLTKHGAVAGQTEENSEDARIPGGTHDRETCSKPSFRKKGAAVVVSRYTASRFRRLAKVIRSWTIRRPSPSPRCEAATATDRSSPASPWDSSPAAAMISEPARRTE